MKPDMTPINKFPDLEKPGIDFLSQALKYVFLTTRGDLITRGADWAKRLAIGTSGKVLHSDGTDVEWATLLANEVEVEKRAGATYDDVQDYINFMGDRTVLSGGALTDAGSGVVAVASLTGWVKATDDEDAIGLFFNYGGASTNTLTNLTTHHIYLDYNGGTPQLVTDTDITTHGFKLDHIHLGTAYRDGATMHIHQTSNIGISGIGRVNMHHFEETTGHRVSGMITTGTGTRQLIVSTGVLYEGLNRHPTNAFNTSTGGVFSYWYYDGDLGPAAWVEDTGATQISRTQYNALATGLANLGSNRYGVHWVYMDLDGTHLHIVYGQGNYKANEADDALIPSSLPNIVTDYCVFIAKIICQEGQDTLIISYPWTTVFSSSLATDHGELAGLGGDDHTQYTLHSLADAANDFLVASGANTFVKKTLAETLAIISPLSTRGDMMFRNASVSTRLAKGADNTILAMGADDPEWKTPATILGDLTGANLDVGAFDVRGQTLTADGLTSGRVVFAGASGVLSGNSNFTFATDTLTVTKIAAFEATGAINFGSQAMTNVNIDSGTMSGLQLDGALDVNSQSLTSLLVLSGLSNNSIQIKAQRTQANTGTGIYISSLNASDAESGRITLSSGIDIAVLAFINTTLTGMKLSGALDVNSNNLNNLGSLSAFSLGGKLTAGANEIEGSNFDINGGAIDGVTIGGTAAPTVTDLGSVAACDINGGTIAGVTIDGDLTWSSAQTGVTLTSPTINGTIATTGLTLPAFALGDTLDANDQIIDDAIVKLSLNHGTADDTLAHSIARGTWDFAVDGGGGAIGLHVTIPDNAIIIKAWYEVITTLTSAGDDGTGRLDVPVDHDGGILGAIAINDLSDPWDAGYHDCTPDGTTANFTNKTTAAREITMSVGVEAFTAGKFVLWCEYVVSD